MTDLQLKIWQTLQLDSPMYLEDHRGSFLKVSGVEEKLNCAQSLYGGLFLLMIHPNKYFCSRTIGLNTLRDRIFPTLRSEDIRGYHSMFKSHVHYMLIFVPNR